MQVRCATASGLRVATVIAFVWAVASSPADALTIGGQGGAAFDVQPIWFTGFGQFGLSSAGDGVDYAASAPVTFLSIGPEPGTGFDLALAQSLQQPVFQHPQDPANSQNPGTNGGVPSTPTLCPSS